MDQDSGFLLGLSPIEGKNVQAGFDGGMLSSDGGLLLLREIERRLGIADRLSRCMRDHRAPEKVRHAVADMIRFRILAIAAGYENANDCSGLRTDPVFKMAVGRAPRVAPALKSPATLPCA